MQSCQATLAGLTVTRKATTMYVPAEFISFRTMVELLDEAIGPVLIKGPRKALRWPLAFWARQKVASTWSMPDKAGGQCKKRTPPLSDRFDSLKGEVLYVYTGQVNSPSGKP